MIPLARPILGKEEEQAVIDVLRSGHLSLGLWVEEFERRFAERLGVGRASVGSGAAARLHASVVSSGTAGLHLALRAAGVGEGDEVITSPFSFVASANVALYERARPVFADIDPVTLNLDPAAAEAAVTARTKAILPVHVFGYPADMAAFERIAARHGLAIVEDACEALGGVHADGIPVGGRGNPAVFGFYANKQLTTREGGWWLWATRRSRRASTPSATRDAPRTWAGSTTTGSGSTTGCPPWHARSASRSCGGWRRCWRRGRGRRRCTGRRSRGSTAWSSPARIAERSGGAGSYSSCRCLARSIATR